MEKKPVVIITELGNSYLKTVKEINVYGHYVNDLDNLVIKNVLKIVRNRITRIRIRIVYFNYRPWIK